MIGTAEARFAAAVASANAATQPESAASVGQILAHLLGDRPDDRQLRGTPLDAIADTGWPVRGGEPA